MKKGIFKILMALVILMLAISCGKKNDTINIVFLPNESNDSLKASREEFAKIIEKATGKKANIVTTTDYNIAMENIISGQAQIAYIGAEGILSADKKTKDVQAIATNAGKSGTNADALYYSFIAVPSDAANNYKVGNTYDLKKLKGKKVSFVTNSSTSGFVVPGEVFVKEFGLKNTDELLQEGKVFSKVIFGNSHPGTEVNLLKKDVDVATFAIPKSFTTFELVSGEENKAGATYKVKVGAPSPFGEYAGKSFTVVKSIPVPNGAIVFNVKSLSKDDQAKVKAALLSKETHDNPAIFSAKSSKIRGLFLKESDKAGFVEVNNKWYEDIMKEK